MKRFHWNFSSNFSVYKDGHLTIHVIHSVNIDTGVAHNHSKQKTKLIKIWLGRDVSENWLSIDAAVASPVFQISSIRCCWCEHGSLFWKHQKSTNNTFSCLCNKTTRNDNRSDWNIFKCQCSASWTCFHERKHLHTE